MYARLALHVVQEARETGLPLTLVSERGVLRDESRVLVDQRISRKRFVGPGQLARQDKRQYDQRHRQPEPEKDFQKKAAHKCSLIDSAGRAHIALTTQTGRARARVDVADTAHGLQSIDISHAMPQLLAQVADVHVYAAVIG